MSLAQRQFSLADQLKFADYSGDRNPMHLDPIEARRTQAGAPVVHGIHLLLWALDSYCAARQDLPPMMRMRIQFQKFVLMEEDVSLEVIKEDSADIRLSIKANQAPCIRIDIKVGNPSEDLTPSLARPCGEVTARSTPEVLSLEDIQTQAGRIPLFQLSTQSNTLFLFCTRWLGASRIAAITATTYLVGMTCPGLHSIFSELSISRCSDSSEGYLDFKVANVDRRFRLVRLDIAGGGISGEIKSFVRLPPAVQPSTESLRSFVHPGEFAGSVALVVGGSRGLGELTAKLIAAGGGHVVITWHTGRADAERVAADINRSSGTCDILRYDSRESAAEQLGHLQLVPTHVYYFATPQIFKQGTEIFSSHRILLFHQIYVEGFWNLVQETRSRNPNVSLFYPSSIAIAERPKGMTEYSMSKAAGEILCADINMSLSPTHVTVGRLPRLPTDQTATIAAVETADPVATMLPFIRMVQAPA